MMASDKRSDSLIDRRAESARMPIRVYGSIGLMAAHHNQAHHVAYLW